MNAEIISIGNELLNGHTINSNASYIAGKLTEIGVPVNWITAVGDSEDKLIEIIEIADTRSDFIIATGGLGPTHDDITKHVFIQYFNSNLIRNETILRKLEARFKKIGRKLSKVNEGQAWVPENAKIIDNEIGTAPGLLFQKNNRCFFVLPGVPSEMELMVDNFLIPFIKAKNTKKIITRKLRTYGLPESTLFETLGDLRKMEKYARIAFLPHFGLIDIHLTANGDNLETCQKNIATVESNIRRKVNDIIWGTDKQTFGEVIVNQLLNQKKTLSLVEYGTEGEIAAQLLKCDEKQAAIQNSLTIQSSSGLINMLKIHLDALSTDKIVSQEMSLKISKEMRKISGSDIVIAILHNHLNKPTSFATIFDGKSEYTHHFYFPYRKALSNKRLAIAVLNSLYRYLSKQKSLD